MKFLSKHKKIKSFDGTSISYNICRISGHFLVFIHGAGGDLNAWKKERRYFHKKGISTIAIDLRGHGMSQRPRLAKDYKLDNFATDIYQVIRKEKIRNFVLIGHCFGGVVITSFHRLFSRKARAYILIDITYKAPKQLRILFKNKFIKKMVIKKLEKNHIEKKNSRRDFRKFFGTGDWNMRRIFSDIRSTSLKSWLFTYKNFSGFDGISVLKRMKKPVLIIEGEKDTIFSLDTAVKVNKLIPKSRLAVIPEANHILVVNNPEALGQEIEVFLRSLKNFL